MQNRLTKRFGDVTGGDHFQYFNEYNCTPPLMFAENLNFCNKLVTYVVSLAMKSGRAIKCQSALRMKGTCRNKFIPNGNERCMDRNADQILPFPVSIYELQK